MPSKEGENMHPIYTVTIEEPFTFYGECTVKSYGPLINTGACEHIVYHGKPDDFWFEKVEKGGSINDAKETLYKRYIQYLVDERLKKIQPDLDKHRAYQE